MTLATYLPTLMNGGHLSEDDTRHALSLMMRGESTPAQTAAFLTALHMKGETVDEIVGCVRAMREHMVRIDIPDAIDVAGTGGDGLGTFNISTATACVVAGAGVRVAKHGNRAASSACGSADVLEALGVHITLAPARARAIAEEVGMVFLFAPTYHPAMKHVAPIRRELKIKTVFNFIGPFANPAGTKRQLIGAPSYTLARTLAQVGRTLEYERLLIVSSEDGMDEISINSPTHLFTVEGTQVRESIINPRALGFAPCDVSALAGDTPVENADILRRILNGEKGPKRDAIIINSAFALIAAGRAHDTNTAIAIAEESIDTGSAKTVLTTLITSCALPEVHQ